MTTETSQSGPCTSDALVSIVIPTSTDGVLVPDTAAALLEALDFPVEIVVVANGDHPRTLAAVRELAGREARVRVVFEPRKIGKGWAILQGLRQTHGAVIGFVDADGPFRPDDVRQLIARVRDGEVDCAIASKWQGQRYAAVDSYARPSRKFLSRGLNQLTRRAFGLPFADTQGGAKFFTRAVWESIDQRFSCVGFDFDVELLWKVRRAGFRVREEFMVSAKSSASTFRIAEIASMLYHLGLLRFRGHG